MTNIPNPLEGKNPSVHTIPLHDGSNEQVSIIVVHRDRPEYLNMCMQSIHVMSNLNNYEVIVVDNGSGQESQDYLNVLGEEGIKVIKNKDNLYWSAAANQGAALADKNSKYFIFMHCDTVVLNQSWIDLMIGIADSKQSGIVGIELESYVVGNQKSDFVKEWCMLVTRECWQDAGPWDEELPLVGNAYILNLRAQFRGYKPLAVRNQLVHHYGIVSFDPNKYDQISEAAYNILPGKIRDAQVV